MTPGFYWVFWMDRWRPAEYLGDELWRVFATDHIVEREGRNQWHGVKIGPRIKAPKVDDPSIEGE